MSSSHHCKEREVKEENAANRISCSSACAANRTAGQKKQAKLMEEGNNHLDPILIHPPSDDNQDHPNPGRTGQRSWTDLVLDDFEIQCGKISPEGRERLLRGSGSSSSSSWSLEWRLFLDFLLCQLVFGPLVISFWRGIWDYATLVSKNVFGPEDCLTPNLLSLSVGLSGSFLLQLFQHSVRSRLAGPRFNSLRSSVVSKTFCVIFGFFDVHFWKGIWDGVNCMFGQSWDVALCTTVLGLLFLTPAGTVRSVISAPVGTTLDTREWCCRSQTYLGTRESDAFLHRCADVLVSLFFEGCCVLVWHGVWILQDLYFMTDYPRWSSMVLGFAISVVVFFLQFPFQRVYLSPTVPYSLKSLLNFFMSLICGLATVSSFRGIWFFLDEYFMRDRLDLSLIHGQLYGAFLLLLFSCGGALQPGVLRDCPNNRDGYLLPFFYTTYYFIKETDERLVRTKKEENEGEFVNKSTVCQRNGSVCNHL